MGTAIYCAAVLMSGVLLHKTDHPGALFAAVAVMLVIVLALDCALIAAVRALSSV